MSPEVLLVESSLNVAGIVIYALRRTVPDITIEYVKGASPALDFLFRTGEYINRTPEQVPDLILLSMTLPHNDAGELLHIIKSYVRTQAVPVVRLTAASGEGLPFEQFPINAHSYIMKSDNRDEFMRQIARVAAYWLNAGTPERSENNSPDFAGSRH